MRKRLYLLFTGLLLGSLLLSGCAAKKETDSAPSPTPAVETPAQAEAQGKLAEAVRAMLSVYDAELSRVAPQAPYHLTYTIPGDNLRQMALDAQETGAVPVDGRYLFTHRESGRFT